MIRRVDVINGEQGQARGLLDKQPVPDGVLFFFPWVKALQAHTVGMHEPIRLLPIRADGFALSVDVLLLPSQVYSLPAGTVHVFEASHRTPIRAELEHVWRALGPQLKHEGYV